MAGIENLKELTKLFDAVGNLLEAALEDDGKITVSDLLDKDVLGALVDLAKEGRETYLDFDQLEKEAKDLNTLESFQLIQTYLTSGRKVFTTLKKYHNKK